MQTYLFLGLTLIILVTIGGQAQAQSCTITEEIWPIKTYPFSDPNPVPILLSQPALYPYFTFDGLSQRSEMRNWKVVKLENQYLQVFILPEVGGKVYGAIEKSTGQEFVYLNHVLKFRQIALRGPWTSGGIEFNFGIVGHTPATATPVDYVLQTHPDGRVSCVVGNYDWPSRTRWSVTISLAPDQAYFETKALWFNPTPLHQSYYCWLNNAIPVGADLEYFYPGQFVIPHSYDTPPEPWPIDRQGRNLAWYRHNNFGGDKSHFILGEYLNFYGGYWHDSQFGFGHWARYDDMPGKKMWIWSLARQGAIWEQLLTDADGQYSEPQAGRLFSQVDHAAFTPYTGDVWREIWFPFKGIGGLVQAAPDAALNLTRARDSVSVRLCALRNLDEELHLCLDQNEIFRDSLHLKPLEIYQKQISVPAASGAMQVFLGKKLFYTDAPGAYDIHRPIQYQPMDETTTEGRYLKGASIEKRRQYQEAAARYQAVVAREPLHCRALTRLAEIAFRQGLDSSALEYASQALKVDQYDPDANYVYGIAARRLGRLVDAKETLGWAARAMQYRSNAYCQLAEIALQEENSELALEYAQRAVDFNKYNLRGHEVLAIAYRKSGQADAARATLAQLPEIEPLNHLARFEQHLLAPDQASLNNFTARIRNEFPAETYLELAIFYDQLALAAEAIQMLELAPAHPTIFYWLAYSYRDQTPTRSLHYLEKAQALSPHLVFPFRPESIPVFQWAIDRAATDWKAKYYLGLIYWHLDQTEKAWSLFAACQDAPDFAPFYVIQAHFAETQGSPTALTYREKALALDTGNWRYWHDLARHYTRAGQYRAAENLLTRARQQFPEHPFLVMDQIRLYFAQGQYKKCVPMLEQIELLPHEGASEAHQLFRQSYLYLALDAMHQRQYRTALRLLEKSRAYPERLGTGAPFAPDYRLQDYLARQCYLKLQQSEPANARRQAILDYTREHGTKWGDEPFWGALVLSQTGQAEKGLQLLQDWVKIQPDVALMQWYLAKFQGDTAQIAILEPQLAGDSRWTLAAAVLHLVGVE